MTYMKVERAIYNVIVRDSDDKIMDHREGIGRSDAVEFMRSLLRGMDYDEVVIQVHKRIPE